MNYLNIKIRDNVLFVKKKKKKKKKKIYFFF